MTSNQGAATTCEHEGDDEERPGNVAQRAEVDAGEQVNRDAGEPDQGDHDGRQTHDGAQPAAAAALGHAPGHRRRRAEQADRSPQQARSLGAQDTGGGGQRADRGHRREGRTDLLLEVPSDPTSWSARSSWSLGLGQVTEVDRSFGGAHHRSHRGTESPAFVRAAGAEQAVGLDLGEHGRQLLAEHRGLDGTGVGFERPRVGEPVTEHRVEQLQQPLGGVHPTPHPVVRPPRSFQEGAEVGELDAGELVGRCRALQRVDRGRALGGELDEADLLVGSWFGAGEGGFDDLHAQQQPEDPVRAAWAPSWSRTRPPSAAKALGSVTPGGGSSIVARASSMNSWKQAATAASRSLSAAMSSAAWAGSCDGQRRLARSNAAGTSEPSRSNSSANSPSKTL